MLDKYWAAQRRRAEENRKVCEKKRLEANSDHAHVIPKLPTIVVNSEERRDSYMVEVRGLWDVYKNGKYVDSFDTKGAAWRALF